MEFILVLMLPLLVLAVFAVAVGAILEVALAAPRSAHESSARTWRWQPPLVQGDELFAWASDAAKACAASRLAGPRGRETARQITTEIYAGITRALAGSPGAVAQSDVHCPSCRHQRIGVTPPEALAIADSLCANRSRREVALIRDRAARNVAAIGNVGRQAYEKAGVVCPLLLNAGCCAAFDARPVHCRGWCLRGVENARSGDLSDKGTEIVDAHAQTVGRGAEAGLSKGLESAGLDGTVYELNSALVAVLDAPSAAQRWASGESVFETCLRYE